MLFWSGSFLSDMGKLEGKLAKTATPYQKVMNHQCFIPKVRRLLNIIILLLNYE